VLGAAGRYRHLRHHDEGSGLMSESAALNEIETVELRREVERLRAMLDEKMGQLVRVTVERDEARRELAQVLESERGVRRLVILAQHSDRRVLSVEEIRAALAGEEVAP
jgi:hypothetical protein